MLCAHSLPCTQFAEPWKILSNHHLNLIGLLVLHYPTSSQYFTDVETSQLICHASCFCMSGTLVCNDLSIVFIFSRRDFKQHTLNSFPKILQINYPIHQNLSNKFLLVSITLFILIFARINFCAAKEKFFPVYKFSRNSNISFFHAY